MKILITGTHFTPAQALIEQLQKTDQIEIVYVGRKSTREGDQTGSIESIVLPKLGVKFIPIVSGRLSRNLSVWTLFSLLKLPIGFLQSFWIVMKESPDVVISFGGYLGFPVIFWSWWLSIPVVIHEQSLKLGLANWLSLPFSNVIALAFPIKSLSRDKRVVITGNPVRQAVLSTGKASKNIEDFIKSQKTLPKIAVLGGNQGAHFINRLIGKNLTELTSKYVMFHQTGDSKLNDYDYLVEEKNKIASEKYLVSKWFESTDLSRILDSVDLVITRGGMNTLYELALRHKPALVIPIPVSVQTEQLQNAKFFQKAGLGDYLTQAEITDQVFLHRLNGVMKNLDKYRGNETGENYFLKDGAARLSQVVLATKY